MIDEKKLIEDLLHNDGTDFTISVDCGSPETIAKAFQKFVDEMKQGFIKLINAQPKCGWIPVTDEQKPRDRENYFIAYVFGDSSMHFFGEAKYYAYEGNGIVDRPHFSNEGVNGMLVTHWMKIPKLPLPEPQKDGEP